MKATVSLDGIWGFLQSLSLSANNKVWLADKLIESSQKDQITLKKSQQEKYVRESMGRAWNEVKEAEHIGRPLPNAYDLILIR